ncbi:unnamed protein product [Polarella glacialis]|uniref:Uncharacterized protein n=1 Tax=Polarella glacialis TaxID=89957 RepID=A0A813F7Z7_POLGL|nr:unnamed protein product [Polarella glacialis]
MDLLEEAASSVLPGAGLAVVGFHDRLRVRRVRRWVLRFLRRAGQWCSRRRVASACIAALAPGTSEFEGLAVVSAVLSALRREGRFFLVRSATARPPSFSGLSDGLLRFL